MSPYKPKKKKVPAKSKAPNYKTANSMLDNMQDHKEFESLLKFQYPDLDLVKEFRRSIDEIVYILDHPVVCYIANVVKPENQSSSIDDSDDLPFNEMIASLPDDVKEISIVLVTPGGYAHQVAKFVNKIRPRFEKVNFILLNKAMSAGTIFIMSGDKIYMTNRSQIGPIDPQVRAKSGEFVPAQSLLTLVEEIRKRGQIEIDNKKSPAWTDVQMLRMIDPKDIGNAINASNYSINMVKEYLVNHKFKSWVIHSKTSKPVSDQERNDRAQEIASLLCEHDKWKNHGHAITREAAWDVCKLKIEHAEDITGLDRAMRRMWALFYWTFENTNVEKVFISKNYCLLRHQKINSNIKKS
jgi:hypothetical protein